MIKDRKIFHKLKCLCAKALHDDQPLYKIEVPVAFIYPSGAFVGRAK